MAVVAGMGHIHRQAGYIGKYLISFYQMKRWVRDLRLNLPQHLREGLKFHPLWSIRLRIKTRGCWESSNYRHRATRTGSQHPGDQLPVRCANSSTVKRLSILIPSSSVQKSQSFLPVRYSIMHASQKQLPATALFSTSTPKRRAACCTYTLEARCTSPPKVMEEP